MRPGAAVIMLEPPEIPEYRVRHLLAIILNLHYTHLMTGEKPPSLG